MGENVTPVAAVALDRVASYVDPRTNAQEDATFIPVGDGEIFCVLHRPARQGLTGVLLCPSILTEEQKMYGTQVLTARGLAAEGVAAVRFHYRGTGHSSGTFDDITLPTMLEDAAAALSYLRDQMRVRVLALCGGRFGGLIAGLVASGLPRAPLILWDPAVDGPSYFREVFRASQLSAMAGGASVLTVSRAIETVHSLGSVDALGFPIHRALYDSAAAQSLTDIHVGARPVLLVQINPRQQLKADYRRIVGAWASAGASVETSVVVGEGAWSFADSPMPSPRLIAEVSTTWLIRALQSPTA